MAPGQDEEKSKVPAECQIWNFKLAADGCTDQDDLLLSSSINGHLDCVKACLAAGADVNTRDRWDDQPALICAVKNGSVPCIELLLKAGADVNIRDNYGETALFDAVSQGSVQCTDLLLKAGADVNIREVKRKTALFNAVKNGSVQCTDLLLKAGADVNIREVKRKTALFNAVKNGSVQCTDLLLKAGADVNIRDHDSETALFIAVRNGSVKCTELLLKARAEAYRAEETVLFGLCEFRITPEVLNMLKIILRQRIKVNVRDDCYGSNALTYHLDYIRNSSTAPEYIKFVMLLFAAGETVDETKVKVPNYLKPSAEISLMNICRETIRKHLLQMSSINLFIRVPRLPLPRLMTSYLLYNVTLDYEVDKKP